MFKTVLFSDHETHVFASLLTRLCIYLCEFFKNNFLLVCFLGNIYFVKTDVKSELGLPTFPPRPQFAKNNERERKRILFRQFFLLLSSLCVQGSVLLNLLSQKTTFYFKI